MREETLENSFFSGIVFYRESASYLLLARQNWAEQVESMVDNLEKTFTVQVFLFLWANFLK